MAMNPRYVIRDPTLESWKVADRRSITACVDTIENDSGSRPEFSVVPFAETAFLYDGPETRRHPRAIAALFSPDGDSEGWFVSINESEERTIALKHGNDTNPIFGFCCGGELTILKCCLVSRNHAIECLSSLSNGEPYRDVFEFVSFGEAIR